MKIGLICRGRTRSSIIQDSLSKKHKLINNFEIYLRAQKVFKKSEINNNFQTELKNITNTMFKTKLYL